MPTNRRWDLIRRLKVKADFGGETVLYIYAEVKRVGCGWCQIFDSSTK